MIAMPLEYEHEENCFSQHHAFPGNAAMIEQVAHQLGEDTILAVTNHPLTELYGDTSAVVSAVFEQRGKVRLIPGDEIHGLTTLALARYCDGFVVGNSKSWSAAAFWGTPIARLSRFATGAWVNAYDDVTDLAGDLALGKARAFEPVDPARWQPALEHHSEWAGKVPA
ncbi:hypothetical protein [Erythrobacter sp.]|uniref:hypothetical protein n=1 Tax=Erythrobacter sp. TaxID=1042 RepID=UPI001425E430|nr:hypothetical protein [Erythrobacter sp.]QIQ86277.1 MAG: hypothetical protein G9473_05940 [Erythrobacter sp.]